MADRQPRWPGGTPVAPSGKGPGGGRWKDDGKPNAPRVPWSEALAARLRGAGQAVRDVARRATGRTVGPRDSAAPQFGQTEYGDRFNHESRLAAIRHRYQLPADANGDEMGEAIRYFATEGRVGSPGRSTRQLEPAEQLDFRRSQAKTYKSTGALKRAEKREGPASITAEWGEQQNFTGPWYAVLDDNGNVKYGSAAKEWEDMHEEVKPGHYRKVADVEAYQYQGRRGRLATVLADGTQETSNHAYRGDWLVRQKNGEVQIVRDDEFRQRYDADNGADIENPYAIMPGTPEYEQLRAKLNSQTVADALKGDGEDSRVAMPGTPAYEEARRRAGVMQDPEAWAAEVDRSLGRGPSKFAGDEPPGGQYSVEDVRTIAHSSPEEIRARLERMSTGDLQQMRDSLATDFSRGKGKLYDRIAIGALDDVLEARGERTQMHAAADRVTGVLGAIRAGRGSRSPVMGRILDHLSEQQLTFAELEDMAHHLQGRQGKPGSTAYDARIHDAIMQALQEQGAPRYQGRS